MGQDRPSGVTTLKAIFASAVAGAAVMLAAVGVSDRPEREFNNKANVTTAVPMAAAKPLSAEDKLWRRLVEYEMTPYALEDAKSDLSAGQRTVAMQIEESLPRIQGFLLEDGFHPGLLMQRHGHACAQIIDVTADDVAGRNVEVHYLDRPNARANWVFNAGSLYAQTLLKNADVIGFSMSEGDSGYMDTQAEIDQAENLWKNSHTIFVWSAGNSGERGSDLLQPEATHFLRADTLLKIGAGYQDVDGKIYLQSFSSPSGASFITSNPYKRGFTYPMVRDEKALRAEIKTILNTVPEGYTKLGRDVLLENIRNLPDMPFGHPLRQIHPSFGNAEFPGSDILVKEPAWLREHPEEVLEAYVNAMIDSAKYLRWMNGAHEDGLIGGHQGTSYNAPYTAGLLAGIHEKYDTLSEYDITAAALIAAEPFENAKRRIHSFHGSFFKLEPVEFRDNGAGIPHNSVDAGFGYLSRTDLENTVAVLARMRAENPALTTEQVWAKAAFREFGADQFRERTLKDGTKVRDYRLRMDEDITALSCMLSLRFGGDVPEKVTLISPSGGQVDIAPSDLGKDMDLSCAWQNGHFGNHTRGKWTVRVPEDTVLEGAQLTVAGMKRGGLIDAYLEKYGPSSPQETSVEAPVPSNENQKLAAPVPALRMAPG